MLLQCLIMYSTSEQVVSAYLSLLKMNGWCKNITHNQRCRLLNVRSDLCSCEKGYTKCPQWALPCATVSTSSNVGVCLCACYVFVFAH